MLKIKKQYCLLKCIEVVLQAKSQESYTWYWISKCCDNFCCHVFFALMMPQQLWYLHCLDFLCIVSGHPFVTRTLFSEILFNFSYKIRKIFNVPSNFFYVRSIYFDIFAMWQSRVLTTGLPGFVFLCDFLETSWIVAFFRLLAVFSSKRPNVVNSSILVLILILFNFHSV